MIWLQILNSRRVTITTGFNKPNVIIPEGCTRNSTAIEQLEQNVPLVCEPFKVDGVVDNFNYECYCKYVRSYGFQFNDIQLKVGFCFRTDKCNSAKGLNRISVNRPLIS